MPQNGVEDVKAYVKKAAFEDCEPIVNALVNKAKEGNYGAARYLLELGGVFADKLKAKPAAPLDEQSRMVLLEIVELILNERIVAP